VSDAPRSSATASVPGSFRDPSGHLFTRDGVLLRTVAPGFAESYEAVKASGLYEALITAGLLVAHTEVDPGLAPAPAHAVLQPDVIEFISYPYEWSPAQLREAALLTLRIMDVALDHGMILRDASAYNVQFVGTTPIFIDTLSFEPRVTGERWIAYSQFCRHFLAPLALQTLVDHRLADLQRTNIDGVPLDLAAALLPGRTKLRPGLLTHIHAQAKASAKGGQADPDAAPGRTVRFSELAMRGLVDGLRGTVERLRWDRGRTEWGDYYAEAAHYTDDAMADKAQTVERFVRTVAPSMVWDLGANTGRFSAIAASTGATVLALDIDHGAVESGYRSLRAQQLPAGSVLPLRYDLANPTPSIGWATEERMSLAERGPADLLLALALVHHLAIGNNVPLDRVAAHLASLGEHLVIEWVPKDDPKVRVLLATREDVFDQYTDAGFRAAFAQHFELLEEQPVRESGRVLHLMRAR
jgi:ribosomal protein L11 methylase PrmA